MPTCYRHPKRETGVSCSSCGRPICPDCMTPTNVGMRCPECAKERTKVVRMREMVRVPRVTYALIAINVLAFLAEKGQFTLYGSSIHGFLINEGVLFREAVAGPYDQYWRLLTNAFLHENFLHIGFNMYILYLVGVMLEPSIGSLRFAAIYAAGLFAGSLGVVIASSSPSLGASGAIFGLLGAAVIDLRGRGHRVAETGIGTLIVLALLLTFLIPNISIGAHIGGLIGGTLAALAVREADKRGWPALGMIACLAICVACIAGSILIANAATGTGLA